MVSAPAAPQEAAPNGSNSSSRQPIVLQATLIDDEHNQQLSKRRLQRRRIVIWSTVAVILVLLGIVIGALFGAGVFEDESHQNFLNVTTVAPTRTPSLTTSNQSSTSPSFSPSTFPSSEPTATSRPTISEAPTRFFFSQRSEISSTSNGDRFGSSIALSKDGRVLAVGAPQFTPHESIPQAGAVYLYVWEENDWISSKAQFIVSGTYAQQGFGHSVALNDDGSVLAIGSANSSPLGSTDGRFDVASIYKYDADQNTLIEQGESILKVDNGDGKLAASEVSLSGDGQELVVDWAMHSDMNTMGLIGCRLAAPSLEMR